MTNNKGPVQPMVETVNLSKRFGDFYANRDISFTLYPGEVHVLLGENGAGKSTLMNLLAGLLQPTSGEIYIRGEMVEIDSPSKANELGIGMVHQHFMLIEDFTVLDNIILGAEPEKNGVIDRKKARVELEKLSEEYGLQVDLDVRVEDLTVGAQQRVEILKTLYRGADVLIFDEPTAVLTPQEIEELMLTIRHLTKEGKGVILITHKLDEIKQAGDRCTIIRRGEVIGTVDVKDTSVQEMAHMMVGRVVSFETEKEEQEPGDTMLKVDNLVVNDSRGLPAVKNLSFEVKAGEIVGIAGIDGNGQSELVLALSGITPTESGTVTFKGEDITNAKPRVVTEAGLGHIPEDRHRYGLVLDMALDENLVLQEYYKEPYSVRGVFNKKAIEEHAREIVEEYDVRTTSIKAPARSLSGGNQQKAILGRVFTMEPDCVLANNPTRGLDVGAIELIHKRLVDQRNAGKGVLLVSFELDEIMDLSDRILVMFEGKVVANIPASETNEEELGLLMAGTSYEEVVLMRKKGNGANV